MMLLVCYTFLYKCIHPYIVRLRPYILYIFLYTYLQPYFCIMQIKGILKNRTQIEEWIEDKAIRRRWQHQRHKERSDSEDSSDEEEEQETTKEKASSKKKTEDIKPFVYPYDLGWKRNLAQVSGGCCRHFTPSSTHGV